MNKKKTKSKRAPAGKRKKKIANKAPASRRTKRSVGKRKSRKPPVKVTHSVWHSVKPTLVRLVIIAFLAVLGYTAYLDIDIRRKFEGQKWALPAHVYTRPMELYVGQKVKSNAIQSELNELGYQQLDDTQGVGSYRISNNRLDIVQREFRFWDGLQEQQVLTIQFANGQINSILVSDSAGDMQATEIIRLEPRLFGSVSPLSHEDRTLLRLENVPTNLVNALIAIEDQQFYSHFGVNPFGIARAMVRNIIAGKFVQGGSTLTQQLVKNYYLSSDRTISRKFTEMIMAILLEVHYSKDEIMQAYLNEVHLSQAGNRAIHGFGLGSRYFFGRPLQELKLSQLAMLAGIIKGTSAYNPIRHPERAKSRRDLVLKTMLEQQFISQQEYHQAIASELDLSNMTTQVAPLSYPSFLGFVRDNLQDEYQQEDLLNDGLQIYTTLNPRIQQSLEQAAQAELTAIEKRKGIDSNTLQVAAVVIRTDNGEVAAMIGDRKASFSGFNRALDARRPVGSLLKPFIYLTALEMPTQYSLATPIDDVSITVTQRGSPDWQPQNYDGREHGSVMLIDALSKSYNLATVQLGMQLGVSEVAATIRRLGYDEPIHELPSLLLGALPMTVIDVGQLYLSLASGGFKTPIKGIRSVLSNENQPLARYPLQIEQVVEPQFNNLINYALQEVVRRGTGRVVSNGFRYDYGLAGKTGTTDEYRDSWFAGFSGNYLTVVWIGRDDNKSTGLTGASGAARLWSKVMQKIPMQRLELPYHEDVIPQLIHYSLEFEKYDCSLSRQLPILVASLPLERIPCAERMQYDLNNDEKKHFEPSLNDTPPIKTKRKSFWERIFG